MKHSPDRSLNRSLPCFRGYGLAFQSEIDLPWPAAAGGGEPEVSIRRGAVPHSLTAAADRNACWQTAAEGLLLGADGIARCLVAERGRLVRVELGERGADAFACLLDSVLAACLHMRGILPLHASAIATAKGAVLIAGRVASGKSTLAAALIDQGYSLLADGIVGVASGGGEPPVALAGFPQVRLWSGAMKTLDPYWRETAEAPVRQGIESYPVAARRFHGAALPVRSIYFLTARGCEQPAVEPLAAVPALCALMERTCRFSFLRGLGRSEAHFHTAAAVARGAQAALLHKPRPACPPEELAAILAKHLPPPCP